MTNWSIIRRVCFLCIKLSDGKSPQDELRINSCWSWIRRRRRVGDGGDFCRSLLFIKGEFFVGDWTRWWTIVVGDGERVWCLRDLVGLGRVFNNDWSWKRKWSLLRHNDLLFLIYDSHKSSVWEIYSLQTNLSCSCWWQ